MKRFAVGAILLATIAAPTFSRAETQTYTRHIAVGTFGAVVSDLSNGVVDGCKDPGTLDGVDGAYVRLDDADLGKAFTLTYQGATGEEDADLYFWDETCLISAGSFEEEGPEAGTVPPNARWASLYLYQGANADVTLSVTR